MVQRHIGMTMKGVRTALSCAVGVGRGKGALVDLGELHGVVLSTVQHPAIHYDYYLQSLKTKMVVVAMMVWKPVRVRLSSRPACVTE
jgi:hypothetical protein